MSDDRWERVKDLVHQALLLPAPARAQFLDDSCGEDLALRTEVESLLSIDADVQSQFLMSAAGDPFDSEVAGYRDGDVLAGRYVLSRKLGEGGMGQVWLAEQTAPVRRQVALKLIRAGMYDASVINRFQAERQSLAIMDHPCIAKVFDAGTTPQGQPYFVMEYVPGPPITEYCDEKRLPIPDRLQLFIQVCEGVQHAHQKAIIHRDIKPANILVIEVDGKPVPRLIDFGLAKPTTPRVAEQTLFTQFGQFMGTPGYMSPEQVDPEIQDIDTRTDVYSLGVVLYVLLAGMQPFENKRRQRPPLDEWLRQLREGEAPGPSTKLGADRESAQAAAHARGLDVKPLIRALRGDLDWISLKALERDRARRYGTPSELSADLRRHLNHEPVLARPAGRAYQLRKFIRRNRLATAGAALVTVLAVVASLAGIIAVRNEREARYQAQRAGAEAETARQTTHFLVDLFRISDPSEARGNSVTAREMLDKGAARVEAELGRQPSIQATLMDTVGAVYMGLGLYRQARPLLEKSLETRLKVDSTEPAVVSESLNHLGELQMLQAEYAAAEQRYRAVLQLEKARPPDPRDQAALAQAEFGLGIVLGSLGRNAEARESLRHSLALRRAIDGPDSGQAARTLKELANVVAADGDLKGAITMMREAVRVQRRLHGEEVHPDLYEAINDLAVMLDNDQQYQDAEQLFDEALTMARRLYGEKHAEVAGCLMSLADTLRSQGKLADAETTYRRALAMQRELLGEEHPDVAFALSGLAFVQYDRGETQNALGTLRESLAVYRHLFPGDHPDVARTLNRLGFWQTLAADYVGARRDLDDALQMRRRLYGDSHPEIASSLTHLSILQVATRDFDGALESAGTARRIYAAAYSPDHWRALLPAAAEGAALTGLGRYPEAEKLLVHSSEVLNKDPEVLPAYRNLARLYLEALRKRMHRAAG